jgi:hypothetical protein
MLDCMGHRGTGRTDPMLDAEYLAHCLDLLYRRTLDETLSDDDRADTAYALATLEIRVLSNPHLAVLLTNMRLDTES